MLLWLCSPLMNSLLTYAQEMRLGHSRQVIVHFDERCISKTLDFVLLSFAFVLIKKIFPPSDSKKGVEETGLLRT